MRFFSLIACVTLGCAVPLPPHAPGLDGAGIDAARSDAGAIFVGNDAASFDGGPLSNTDGGVQLVDAFSEDAARVDGSLSASDGGVFTDAGDDFTDAGELPDAEISGGDSGGSDDASGI